MTRCARTDPEKASPDAYDQKMARRRPVFLNQETLDSVAREHQLEARSKASKPHEA